MCSRSTTTRKTFCSRFLRRETECPWRKVMSNLQTQWILTFRIKAETQHLCQCRILFHSVQLMSATAMRLRLFMQTSFLIKVRMLEFSCARTTRRSLTLLMNAIEFLMNWLTATTARRPPTLNLLKMQGFLKNHFLLRITTDFCGFQQNTSQPSKEKHL